MLRIFLALDNINNRCQNNFIGELSAAIVSELRREVTHSVDKYVTTILHPPALTH